MSGVQGTNDFPLDEYSINDINNFLWDDADNERCIYEKLIILDGTCSNRGEARDKVYDEIRRKNLNRYSIGIKYLNDEGKEYLFVEASWAERY